MKNLIFLFLTFSFLNTQGQYISRTYSGNGTAGFINGDSTAARFKTPFGLCRDKAGNIYVADAGNNCIRKISKAGVVTTLAGKGTAGFADGKGDTAKFNSPTGVCVDDSGNVYVADFQNQRIRKISVSGFVTTLVGTGVAGYKDGLADSAMLNYPRGIARDHKGNLYIGDSWNHRIRIFSGNWISTYAGGGSSMGVQSVGDYKDGKDTSARFYTPAGLSIHPSGDLFVADAYNHRIRKIDINGNVTTVVGSGATGQNMGGFADGTKATAILNVPTECYIDSTGNLYIGDTFNNKVRAVIDDSVFTLAGNGTAGYINGNGASSEFNYPRGVVEVDGRIFVADYNNSSIRVISEGTITGIDKNRNYSTIFSVFPNPSNGKVTIVSEGGTCKITDLLGKEVFNRTITETKTQIDLTFLKSGMYFLSLAKGNQVEKFKLVIN